MLRYVYGFPYRKMNNVITLFGTYVTRTGRAYDSTWYGYDRLHCHGQIELYFGSASRMVMTGVSRVSGTVPCLSSR